MIELAPEQRRKFLPLESLQCTSGDAHGCVQRTAADHKHIDGWLMTQYKYVWRGYGGGTRQFVYDTNKTSLQFTPAAAIDWCPTQRHRHAAAAGLEGVCPDAAGKYQPHAGIANQRRTHHDQKDNDCRGADQPQPWRPTTRAGGSIENIHGESARGNG